MSKVILVTGASSGIGRRIAATLARNGHRVFGTSRHPKSDILDGFELTQLDVTSDESARACVQAVLQKAGHIDVLVNNAGIELLGALEEVSLDEARQLFETNFFGVARMCNLVLPHMRERKSGQIVNISSISGFTFAPFQGYYAASKHALEGYSAALKLEVEPFGVDIALVEPGYFKSEIGAKRIQAQSSVAAYDRARKRFLPNWERHITNGADPQPVADVVLQIVEERSNGFRHVVGGPIAQVSRLSVISPHRVTTAIVRRYVGLRPLRKDLPWGVAVLASFYALLQIRSFFKRLKSRDRNND